MNTTSPDRLMKRFEDLSRQANQRGYVTYSDFLSLHEQNVLFQVKNKLATEVRLAGGYEFAERQLAAFVPTDALVFYSDKKMSQAEAFPICCIRIQPLYPKFAEKIGHRDILGALMSLGINRGKLGDIIANDEDLLVFVEESMVDYIMQELTSIRHTMVTLSVETNTKGYQPRLEYHETVISSNRLDAVIAGITRLSRSNAMKLIIEGKIFINGQECQNHTYECKENDQISIRGFGKIRFSGVLGTTKKDRTKIGYESFI